MGDDFEIAIMNVNGQAIEKMVQKMPAFPRSVHRVLELTSDMNSNPRELIDVIEHDPVLLLKILKLVNSPYFGLAEKITSVNHAVVYIGLNTIKNLALSAAAVGILPRTNKAGFDMNGFLLHSLSTATIARMFAKKMKVPGKDTFDYFMSGLLHDFGKIVFAHFLPDEFRKALNLAKEKGIPLFEAEQEIFGMDHSQVITLLGEKWLLAPGLVDSMEGHHYCGDKCTLFTHTIAVSNQLSKELKMGDSGSSHLIETLPDDITQRFGNDVDAIVGELGDVKDEIDKAAVFIAP